MNKRSFFSALLLGLAVWLSGCAGQAVKNAELMAQKSAPLLTGFATLADSGNPAEMAAAPVYTRLALYRKRAAAYLNNGLISISQARQAQETADSIRRQLDNARADSRILTIQGLSRLLDLALNSLEGKT